VVNHTIDDLSSVAGGDASVPGIVVARHEGSRRFSTMSPTQWLRLGETRIDREPD